MVNPYLEQSMAIVQGTDVEALAGIDEPERAGAGTSLTFWQLGALPVAKVAEPGPYAGIKIPKRDPGGIESQVQDEVAYMGMLSRQAPGIIPRLPKFAAVLQVADGGAAAILTEDVSEGGRLKVRSTAVSAEARSMMAAPLNKLVLPEDTEILREGRCNNGIAVAAGDQEKLINFTPLPTPRSLLTQLLAFQQAEQETAELMPELTISLPPDSPLGQALEIISRNNRQPFPSEDRRKQP